VRTRCDCWFKHAPDITWKGHKTGYLIFNSLLYHRSSHLHLFLHTDVHDRQLEPSRQTILSIRLEVKLDFFDLVETCSFGINTVDSTRDTMPIATLDLDHLLTSTKQADFPGRTALADVSSSIAKAKRVVVVSGAGISCSSGIPVSHRNNWTCELLTNRIFEVPMDYTPSLNPDTPMLSLLARIYSVLAYSATLQRPRYSIHSSLNSTFPAKLPNPPVHII